MDFSQKTFSIPDYVVFALMLCISSAIGLFYLIKDRKKQNTEEYLLAGRSMSAYPVAFSLSVGYMSAILFLGTPSEIYRFGTMLLWLIVAFAIMSIVTAEIYIPMFYNMQLTSVYEYLEKRFNRLIRIEGTIIYMIQTMLYLGIVIYAPALALNSVTGLDLWGAVISTGFICILYSTLGGLKAVIWTDAIQAIVMIVGLLSVVIQGSVLMGGFGNVWSKSMDGGRLELFKFTLDPRERHTVWSVTVGGTFMFMSLYAVGQGQVQRYLSCKSLTEAKKAILINVLGLWCLYILAILCGITMYSYYKGCDPVLLGVVDKPDQMMPYMVLDIFQNYPGMSGIFLTSVYSGSLSTISTSITALASVTVEDYLKPSFNFNERTYTWISRGLVVFFGVICIIFSYLVSTLGAILEAAISIIGLVGGPLVGLYTLGLLFPFSNSLGAFVGINMGIAADTWIFIGSKRYPPAPQFIDELPLSLDECPLSAFINFTNSRNSNEMFSINETTTFQVNTLNNSLATSSGFGLYSMSYMLYSPFGFMCTVVIGLVVSLLSGGYKNRRHVDPLLIYPFFDHWLFAHLPESFKSFMRTEEKKGSQTHRDEETSFIY